jgi:hypothetical protein
MKLRARFFFSLFFSCFVLLRGLVANRNKFFNTTDGEAVRPGVVESRIHVATMEIHVVRARTATRRGRIVLAVVAYDGQLAVSVATVPDSGKNAVTGLNVFADRTIPEHKQSLGFITNGKHISCWRAAEFIGHTFIRRYV